MIAETIKSTSFGVDGIKKPITEQAINSIQEAKRGLLENISIACVTTPFDKIMIE